MSVNLQRVANADAVGAEARLMAWARRVLAGIGGQLSRVDPVLLLAIGVGVGVRLWQFGVHPPGLNQDEASMAYDAYALVHYGVDRNGFQFPVMTVSWGSGMYALASYLTAPFVALFGLEVWAMRLPFVLVGIATIPLFYHLVHECLDRRTARIAAVLIALSPWHVMVSRWSLDSNLLPFVFLLATVFLLRSRARPRVLLLACATYALALYAYGTAYVVVPVFLLLAIAYGLVHRLWPRRWLLGAGVTCALVSAPIVLYVLINNLGWESIRTPIFSIPRLSGIPRYQTVANTGVFSHGFFSQAANNLEVAWKLLRFQNDGLIWNAIPEYGILYWFSPGLAILGLALLTERSLARGFQPSFFLLAWCAAACVLCVFLPVNINRANIAMLPLIACVAIAASALWRWRAVAITLTLAFCLSTSGFLANYFGPYRQQVAPQYYASLLEAIRYAAASTPGEICVTEQINMPYIFVLFATRMDPRVFQRSVVYRNPGAEFQRVAAFDRYRFGLKDCAKSSPVIVLANRYDQVPFAKGTYSVKGFELYDVITRQ
jgi:hypothetical protein